MANIRELTDKIAEVTGIESVTVARYARFAREGGYISQAGRGTSAARMQPTDVANMLACILTSGVAQEAPDHIKRVMEMSVGNREADHIDERHLDKEQGKALKKVLPIIFNREHTLYELLLALVEMAVQDPKDFEKRFSTSYISFTCDEYSADVGFEIFTGEDRLLPFARPVNVTFSYAHPGFQQISEYYRRSTYLTFSAIAQICKSMSAK
jgi:hypothetical protein